MRPGVLSIHRKLRVPITNERVRLLPLYILALEPARPIYHCRLRYPEVCLKDNRAVPVPAIFLLEYRVARVPLHIAHPAYFHRMTAHFPHPNTAKTRMLRIDI